jgi:hypothetical protein
MPKKPDFGADELVLLAGFVCGRYDALMEMTTDPRITADDFKRGAAKDARSIATLNAKLRPFYSADAENNGKSD